MNEEDILEFLGQLRSQNASSGFKMSGYDTPDQYVKWAWSNKLGPAPPIVQGLRQQPGMTGGNPFTMEGGYTPDFATAISKSLFPNVRPGLRGMGGYGTNEAPQAETGSAAPTWFNPTAYANLQGQLNQAPNRDVFNRILQAYLAEGGSL